MELFVSETMHVSRREFIVGAAALSLSGAVAPFPVVSAPIDLRAIEGKARLAPPDYPETPIWGYEGQVPGPVLRVKQGERLVRRFVNGLSQPSTIHWHGIRIANAMDGVPDLTQPAVASNGEFTYDFVVPDAGTYWYHPHNRTWEQMARGLYGALIVEEPAPPPVDRDEVLLIDDWRLTQDAEIHESFGAMMDWSHAGRLGNWTTVNGAYPFRMATGRNERLRLRLANTANARVFVLEIRGLDGWIVAIDGQPLVAPERATRIVLAPAQRADLIVDVIGASGSEAGLYSIDRDKVFAVVTFDIGEEAREARPSAPAPLPPNPIRAPGSLERARRVPLHMEGGAMGRMRGATMGGRMMGMRELVGAGKVWAFNGQADMLEAPLVTASAGETLRVQMINDTAWPHAMHLHGHHFKRVVDGKAAGPIRDTLLVDANETAEIAFVADNPGDWLLHCHMLEHSAAGMMTWLRVLG